MEQCRNSILKHRDPFCVLKKWLHSRIGQCVRPAGRRHDNSSQLHPIELKFCAHNCFINISVEFEDEKDPSKNGLVIGKIVIFDKTTPEGGYRDFFKKCFSQNYPQHIQIDSVFNADSESDISFERNRSFRTKYCLKKVSKCTKTASRKQIA